tara:strand:+ start:11339 stop:11791 length:453 start_codon:yes stop_codon:yes gene_type:complete
MNEMSENKGNLFTFECPACKHENSYKTREQFECKSCGEKVSEGHFLMKKRSASTAYLLIIAAATGVSVTNIVTSDRLPYAAEYKLMDACMSGDRRVLSKAVWANKSEVCGCIIEEALDEIGTGRNRNEPDEVIAAFGSAMRDATPGCSEN